MGFDPTHESILVGSGRWSDKRRGWDSNPRGERSRPRDFQSRSLSRSDTSPGLRRVADRSAHPASDAGPRPVRPRTAVVASLGSPGGVPERLNGAVSKTVVRLSAYRGFESHPLRTSLPGQGGVRPEAGDQGGRNSAGNQGGEAAVVLAARAEECGVQLGPLEEPVDVGLPGEADATVGLDRRGGHLDPCLRGGRLGQ